MGVKANEPMPSRDEKIVKPCASSISRKDSTGREPATTTAAEDKTKSPPARGVGGALGATGGATGWTVRTYGTEPEGAAGYGVRVRTQCG